MKIKRINVLTLNNLLVGIGNLMLNLDVRSIKMKYFNSKNIEIMKPEIKAIGDTGYTEYEKERVELVKKHGEKDEKGELKTNENGTVNLPNPAEFTKEVEALKEKHKELFKFLEEEVEIKFHQIKLVDMPDLPLGQQDVDVLLPLISEG
jgi:hypothetical protein